MGIFDVVPEVLEYVGKQVQEGDRVFELGPGPHPAPFATDLVDCVKWIEADNYWIVDLNNEDPPLGGDFYYARHIIEDLRHPEQVLRALVDKRGYIETPSPAHECLVGVYRNSFAIGHIHHYWFCWTEGDTLHLLPKYPIIQERGDNRRRGELDMSPMFWNNYYLFDECKAHIYEPGIDFSLMEPEFKTYFEILLHGTNASAEHTVKFMREMPTK